MPGFHKIIWVWFCVYLWEASWESRFLGGRWRLEVLGSICKHLRVYCSPESAWIAIESPPFYICKTAQNDVFPSFSSLFAVAEKEQISTSSMRFQYLQNQEHYIFSGYELDGFHWVHGRSSHAAAGGEKRGWAASQLTRGVGSLWFGESGIDRDI